MSLPYNKKNSHFVLYSYSEQGEKMNVIEFYNHFFLEKMKIYLKNLKEESQNFKRQIYATPRPIIPSLITNSPLKQFSSNHNFASPFRKLLTEPNMTPFSASLYARDERINKIFMEDFEITTKKLDLSKTSNEKPNNSLLNKIKTNIEGKQQPLLHLKSNSQIFQKNENPPSRSLSRALFGESNENEEESDQE